MAKDLSTQTGIGSDVNYLNGNLVDDQTLIGEGINQDIVQFFQKLMAINGMTANGNSDNETHDYQFVLAALKSFGERNYVENLTATAYDWYTIAKNDGTKASAKFVLWQETTGRNQAVNFYATHELGKSNNITIQSYSTFILENSFQYLRIKANGETDGALLQVYLRKDSQIKVAVYQNEIQDGWELVTPTSTEPISGLSEKTKYFLDSYKTKLKATFLASTTKRVCEILPSADYVGYGLYDVFISEKNNNTPYNRTARFSIMLNGSDIYGTGITNFKILNDYSDADFLTEVNLKQKVIPVTSVSNTSGDIYRYNFASTDISDMAVGDDISFFGYFGGNVGNNGRYRITTLAATYVEVTNSAGVVTASIGQANHKLYLQITNTRSSDLDVEIEVVRKAGSQFRFISQNEDALLSPADGLEGSKKLVADYQRYALTKGGTWAGTLYYKHESNGIVHVWGSLTSSGTTILISSMPAGLEPTSELIVPALDNTDLDTINGIKIETDGNISAMRTFSGGVAINFSVRYATI